MDKVNRGKIIDDIYLLSDHHKISACQVLKIIALSHRIPAQDLTERELVSFVNKGLLTTFEVVNEEVFYKPLVAAGKGEEDLSDKVIKKEHLAKHTQAGVKMADNLFNTFVLPAEREETYIKQLAKKHFNGEYWAAKYYITFRRLFPTGIEEFDIQWNSSFGVKFEGNSRWEESKSIMTKFFTLYKKLDIGVFLTAAYYAVRNGIDFNTSSAFVMNVRKFLNGYEQWMKVASTKLDTHIQSAAHSEEKTASYTGRQSL
jgi:hypothetical protein